MRLTFNSGKTTGRFAWVHNATATPVARFNGVDFAMFCKTGDKSYYKIRIQVDKPAEKITTDDPCSWHWVYLSDMFHSLDAARDFVRTSRNKIYAILATDIKQQIQEAGECLIEKNLKK